VNQLVVAVSADDTHWQALPVASDPRVRTVIGGGERAHSVFNALNALQAAEHDWVLVHDAVRPCIQPGMIEQLLQALGDDAVGGLLALPLADTLKQEQSGRVTATIDRAGLWCAQTPQMFRYGLLKTALRDALQAGVVVTDESAAMERAGHAPRLITGTASNLKVTRADDLSLAAYWLQTHKEQR
jgi:2-C-methyl-D-erythritol 4-phosphate cytidylyltransferase